MAIAARNAEPVEQGAGEPFDREYQKLNFGGHEDLLEDLLAMFRVRAHESLEVILHGYRSGDTPSLLAVVHSLKGNAALVGAREVTKIALSIESAVRDNQWHRVPNLLDMLVEKVNAAVSGCPAGGSA